jgi:hypothetical protein
MTAPTAQTIGPGEKIQTFPNLDNFKLEKFKDLRNEPSTEEQDPAKLMLLGSSNTNIFIYAPDSLVTILLTYLPQYMRKSWTEINNIKFEGISDKCNNFLISTRCDPWIVDKFQIKEISPGGNISYVTSDDLSKAYEICIKCNNFYANYALRHM